MTIKKDDNVKILVGKDKGKTGKVMKAFPRENKVVVAGINKVKRHQRARKEGAKGQVIEMEMPMDVSNVALVK